MLPARYGGDSWDCRVNSEEGGDDVKSSCPLCQGFTHATMAGTKGCDAVRWSESLLKPVSVRIRGLQLDPVKSESLVIADQQRCSEYVGA